MGQAAAIKMRTRISDKTGGVGEENPANNESSYSISGEEARAKLALKKAQSLIMKGLALPCLLCLDECGQSGLLVLSVGCIVCYLFDLLRSAEGTLISIMLTLMVFCAVLLWSLSDVLEESWMNLPTLLAYSTIVLYVFFFCASQFSIVFNEMNYLLHVVLQVMCATLPLVASTLISVSLCEEISAFELPVAFSVVYSVYMCYFGRSQINFIQEVQTGGREGYKTRKNIFYTERLLIHPTVLEILYVLPVPVSLLLSVALHYNVPWRSRAVGSILMQSILLPLLLTAFVKKSHLNHLIYTSREEIEIDRERYDNAITLLAVSLGVNMADHPMLDDLRKLGDLEELTASYVILALVISLVLSSVFIRRCQILQRQAENFAASAASKYWQRIFGLCNTICASFAAGLLCLLIGMPSEMFPLFVSGCVGLNELYFDYNKSAVYKLFLALLSSTCFLVSLPSFFKSNIYYVAFNWAWLIDLSMQRLCHVFIVVILSAALLPSLLLPSSDSQSSSLPTLSLPLTSSTKSSQTIPVERRKFFALALGVFSTVVVCLELLVLEQQWEGVNVEANHVYPEYFFLMTAVVMGYVTDKLHRKKIIGMPTVLVVWSFHAFKFLHYLPMQSADIFSSTTLFITNLLPFVRQLSEYLLRDAANEFDGIESSPTSYISLSQPELIFFIILNTITTFYAGRRIARMVLHVALSKMPTFIQTVMFTSAGYLFFISTILLVFLKDVKWLRSWLFAVGAVLMIVSFEGFGSFSYQTYTSAVDDHSFAFTLLSSGMTVVAWTRTVPLNSVTSCLVYSLLFGFASTKAMLSWVLPESANNIQLISHNVFAFPFIALYVGKASSTFLVLWGSRDKLKHPLFPVLLVVAVLWPMAASILSGLLQYPPALAHGLIWSTIVSTGSTCISFRAQEVLSFLRGHRNTHVLSTYIGEFSLVLIMAMLCMFWTFLAIVTNSSAIDSDILFPVAALLILCEDASFLPYKQHPFTIWTMIVTVWWYNSVLYHIFFRGMGQSILPGLPPYSIFGWDEEVSIWVNESPTLSIINSILALVPFPALYSSVRKSMFNEEILFVFALMSITAIIGANIDCVRYLGLVGMVAAGHACYVKSVSSSKKKHTVI